MANYRNLFPNLTDSDFLAPGSSITNANEAKIYDWAQHGTDGANLIKIPLSKLPDLELSHVFTFNDPATTGSASTPRTDVNALDAFRAAYDAATSGTDPSNLFVNLNPGDLVIVTFIPDNAQASVTDVSEFLYVGAQVNAGAAIPGSGDTDFTRIVQSSADAVNSIATQGATDTNITLFRDGGSEIGADGSAQTGMVEIRLDTALKGITGINNTGTATGLTVGASTATLALAGSTVGITSAAAATITGTSVSVNGNATFNDDVVIGATGNANNESLTVHGNVTLGDDDQTTPTSVTLNGQVLLVDEESAATAGVISAGTTGSKVVVLGTGGAIEHRTLGPAEVGAYTISDEAIATNAVTAELNQVTVVPRQQADLTINLPAAVAGDAGSWIKVINNINLAVQDDVDNSRTNGAVNQLVDIPANQHQITITAPAASLFAGGSTDTDLVVDDLSANFEIIWDGAKWNIFTT